MFIILVYKLFYKSNTIVYLYDIIEDMPKTKCHYCHSSKGMKLICKFCKKSYCTSCLMPEVHNCDNMEDCLSCSRSSLSNELLKNKCIKPKIESI